MLSIGSYKCVLFCGVLGFASFCVADLIVLKGDSETETTGEQFEGVTDAWATYPVLEIDGLSMTARTTDSTQELNANSGEFGINSEIEGEDPGFFDVGETMVFYFDQEVEISLLDMNSLRDEDRFAIKIGSDAEVEIAYDDLSNKTSAFYTFSTPQRVAAETEIRLYSNNGSVGMDGIELQVVPEPAVATLISCTGLSLLLIRRVFKG